MDRADADADRVQRAGGQRRSRGCRPGRSLPPAARCRGRGRERSRMLPTTSAAAQSCGRHAPTTARPSTSADKAMPISPPGRGTPISPSAPPSAITIGNVTGRIQIAGAAELRAPESDRHHREHVIEPRQRMQQAGEQAIGAARDGVRRTRPAARPQARSRSGRVRQPCTRIAGWTAFIASLPAGPACAETSRAHPASRRHSPGAAATIVGQRTCRMRSDRSSSTNTITKPIWPSSTPTLKSSNASGISSFGRPSSARPVAKPRPCSRPNANATTHGWRIVKLLWPRQARTISGPRNTMLRAIAAFSGSSGTLR